MGFLSSVKAQFQPSPVEVLVSPTSRAGDHDQPPATTTQAEAKIEGPEIGDQVRQDPDVEKPQYTVEPVAEKGVATVEAVQAVWGKKGRYIIIAGLAMMMLMYELDNATVYNYQSYATSSFNQLSSLAALGTAGTIIFAVVKPPIAKLSNIIGRGETYIFTISCYCLSYILCSTAPTFNVYAAGYVFYALGQSGTNIMNDIVISDISSARWRGFAIGVSFTPFLVTPWISAFIVNSVVTGIGWRWGIRMFVFLMPFASSFIITTLLYYQAKARRMGLAPKPKITLYDFCAQIDLGGTILLTAGLAMFLLPLTLSATSTSHWRTPYLDVLLALGPTCLLVLPFYEKYVASHPVVPPVYFRNPSIVFSLLLIGLDSLGFACTHTYLFSWAVVTHDFSARDATFFTSINGVIQCLIGIGTGLVMWRTRRYKYLVLGAMIIRAIGYGVMIRLRGPDNSNAELYLVQVVQGIGSGIVQTTVLVAAQIVVPHVQMAQVTALMICTSFVGSSIGSSIAGGIYTNTFQSALEGRLAGEELAGNSTLVEEVFNSITGVLPLWESPERVALDFAFSDVLRYMTYASLGASLLSFVFAWFLPNLRLPDTLTVEEESVRMTGR